MFKTLPKILIIIFLSIFILQLACLIFLLTVPEVSQAADPVKFTPQVDIGKDFKTEKSGGPKGGYEVPKTTEMIGKYIRAIYKYAIGIVGILAAVVLMFGGVLWLTAGGNAERIGNAKSWIGAALTGLVLALTSYMILYMINPALVEFRVIEISDVGEFGCCQSSGIDASCKMTTKENCSKAGESWWSNKTCINDECITKITTDRCCIVKNSSGSGVLFCVNIKDYPTYGCDANSYTQWYSGPCNNYSECNGKIRTP